ncbi:hypothetical protein SAMN04490244_106178 [Tranquillimonas rosea]|uniref:Uncharacterized protein n=1 Tax=Tranquillimonas rosea TaxID=641238 RepID=A0A1H9V2R9_9RHOB|nr:hypothetical protein [Tranquillimonas rosea]SES15603.1 hypothetical protein SAMN04490244_106178 [Tranquillimonas rosea]
MADTPRTDRPTRFNVMVVGQSGRIGYEAALFAASLRHSDPDFAGRLIVAEPQPGPLWQDDPRIADSDLRALLEAELGAEIVPFRSDHFGQSYPYGNKIDGLKALPPDEPFVFFDSDTLITGPLSRVPFDFSRPSASLRREGTWPRIELYGPGYTRIWRSLYDRFGLDFESSLDLSQPDEYWRRYLYFNAGWFFHSDPATFGERFTEYATAIRDDPPDELACQSLDPWLDQVALPLVIHALGGGRQTLPEGLLDGSVSCHYRLLPLLYARESDAVVDLVERITAPNRIKKVLKRHDPIRRMVLQHRGAKVRALFDQSDLPRKEEQIRNRIKRRNLWMR